MGIDAPGSHLILDSTESALELRVRLVERERGVNAGLAAEVDARKKQIPELIFELVVRGGGTGVEMNADFRQLFLDLRRGTRSIRPVETNPGRTVLQTVRTVQSRD